MAGILYGIGVGPGDAELMTIKAARILLSCDIIGIPAKDAGSCTAYRIAVQAVPEIADKPVLSIPVPMTTDSVQLEEAYSDGCGRLAQQLAGNKTVAFLNLGDPTVYGTYMELHRRIKKAGYEGVIINGVPSFCAAAAQLGIPLGAGSESIHILPGFYCPAEVEAYEGTRILMKPARKLPEIKKELLLLEQKGKIKAYAVTNCGMDNQKICEDIKYLDEAAGYFTTIIVKELADKIAKRGK